MDNIRFGLERLCSAYYTDDLGNVHIGDTTVTKEVGNTFTVVKKEHLFKGITKPASALARVIRLEAKEIARTALKGQWEEIERILVDYEQDLVVESFITGKDNWKFTFRYNTENGQEAFSAYLQKDFKKIRFAGSGKNQIVKAKAGLVIECLKKAGFFENK